MINQLVAVVFLLPTSVIVDMASAATLQRVVPRTGSYGPVPRVQYGDPTGTSRATLRVAPYTPAPKVQHRTSGDTGNMLTCTSLDEWHSHEAGDYQGLQVSRSIDPWRWQPVADRFYQQLKNSKEKTINKRTVSLGAPEEVLQEKIVDAAHAVSHGLPVALAQIVCKDAQGMAAALHKMVPDAQSIIMKLELFAEDVCSRWHVDKYVCRSLVSYNCSGTQYTADSNVDFFELYYCGNNDCIIRDKSQIRSANVGDIVAIKGTKFPGKANCIVHKSPEVSYYDSGDVKARLLLKVDIQDVTEGEMI